MLQQTVISAVMPVFTRFMAAFPTLADVADASDARIKECVAGLGYYRRFRLFHEAARKVTADGSPSWPATYDEWRGLPGVGDYTAAAVGSIVLGIPRGVVDGNVERVMCRLHDIRLPPNLPMLKKLFKTAVDAMIPHDAPGDFNQGIMELGQTICTIKAPRCEICPVAEFCLSRERNSQHLAPQKKLAPERIQIETKIVIVQSGGRIALWERDNTARFLKGIRGFPTYIQSSEGQFSADGMAHYPALEKAKSVAVVKHAITRHNISASVAAINLTKSEARKFGPPWVWLDQDAVHNTLVASFDRKAWRAFRIHQQKDRSPTF